MITPIKLDYLVERFGGVVVNHSKNDSVLVTSVSTDTRHIQKGDTFIALKGDRFDAHQFLMLAQESGAGLLVVEAVNDDIAVPQWLVEDTTKALGHIALAHRDNFSGKVVAITGSGGKTTVKGMLYEILQLVSHQKTFATQGNLNNHIGVPLSLLSLEAHHDYAVIEMGASALGEINYLTSLGKPHVAMINNVMPAHVEGFGSVDNIAKAKGEIYNGLVEDGIAVINRDDHYASQWLEQNTHRHVMTFSVGEQWPSSDNHIVAADHQLLSNGSPQFTLRFNGVEALVTLNVLGSHNIANALAAATCALALNVDMKFIVEGLHCFNGVPGRLERLNGVHHSHIIDDSYNANPGSMKAAIDVLAEIPAYKVFVVGDMGELGDMAEQAHKDVGNYASEKSIDCVLSSGVLSAHITNSFLGESHHFENVEKLIAHAEGMSNGHTVFLIKGSRSARMDRVVQALQQRGEK